MQLNKELEDQAAKLERVMKQNAKYARELRAAAKHIALDFGFNNQAGRRCALLLWPAILLPFERDASPTPPKDSDLKKS